MNGVETKAAFKIKDDGYSDVECLFSLAKWKRMVLADYGFEYGEGLYTDMNAIRPDEECLDNLHSVYVDQWDRERVINADERKIYNVLKKTETAVDAKYLHVEPMLPEEISFIHSEELLAMYPDLDARERENRITQKRGAAFVVGIDGELTDGTMHDNRAPDYDDWTTPTSESTRGLNGDILMWYPLLNRAMEISSMGIRVDRKVMLKQLETRGVPERREMIWHCRLRNGELPLTVSGESANRGCACTSYESYMSARCMQVYGRRNGEAL